MKGKAERADQPLSGSAVAVLVSSGFEETEMTEVQRALLKAGAAIQIVAPDQGLVNGWHGKSWGHFFPVDRQIGSVRLVVLNAKVKGRAVSGPEDIKPAAEEIGARWSEDTVSVDGTLVTAQSAEDLSGFVGQVLKVFTDAFQVKKAA